jgi:hypothetical protein
MNTTTTAPANPHFTWHRHEGDGLCNVCGLYSTEAGLKHKALKPGEATQAGQPWAFYVVILADKSTGRGWPQFRSE